MLELVPGDGLLVGQTLKQRLDHKAERPMEF